MVPMQVLSLVLGGSTDSSVAEPTFVLIFGDDHGEEAVVGRRDTGWASGGSAVTNSLLLSAVWVVRAVIADKNAPALGGILNQQGVGNLTSICWIIVIASSPDSICHMESVELEGFVLIRP